MEETVPTIHMPMVRRNIVCVKKRQDGDLPQTHCNMAMVFGACPQFHVANHRARFRARRCARLARVGTVYTESARFR